MSFHVVQLMASPFFGGPERQMLGLALALPRHYQTTFLSFAERGLCRPFLGMVRSHGFEGIELEHNFPHLRRSVNEVAACLRRLRADVVCCSGYKPDLIGLLAARQVRVPIVSVSHGWTGATWRVRFNETLDRMSLRWMDAVVCVSEAQAVKARRTGAPADRIHVIRNAVSLDACQDSGLPFRQELTRLFSTRKRRLVGAAGRLSPEKGFEKLIEAAARLTKDDPNIGVVIFGEGPCRLELTRLIVEMNLSDSVVLPGFRSNLTAYLPHFDVVALSSYTEGLPVIVLEALASGVPVVATAVGGVPEVIEDGVTGRLVQPGDSAALARAITDVLGNNEQRHAMAAKGRQRVQEQFTFETQSVQYQTLFARLVGKTKRSRRTPTPHSAALAAG